MKCIRFTSTDTFHRFVWHEHFRGLRPLHEGPAMDQSGNNVIPPHPTIDGKTYVDNPEARNRKKSIEPRNEVTDLITARIQKKLDDAIQNLKLDTAEKQAARLQYETIRIHLASAIVMKAVVENVPESEIDKQAQKAIEQLTKYIEGGVIMRSPTFDSPLDICMERFETPLVGQNPLLETRRILPKNKEIVKQSLAQIDAHYIAKLKDKYDPYLGAPYYNEPALAFLEKVQFPFYRDYLSNCAIVDNEEPFDLAQNYVKFIHKSLIATIQNHPEEQEKLKEEYEEDERKRFPNRAFLDAVIRIKQVNSIR